MKKMYSLMLSEELVEELDRAAYSLNVNRSTLVNRILAEYLSCTTPEKRMKEVFDHIEKMLDETRDFQNLLQPSDSMITLRTALNYNYNPSVRYSVELNKNTLPLTGELRVSLRSQNNSLLLLMLRFFKLWVRVEARYTGFSEYRLEDGKFYRKLRSSDSKINELDFAKDIAAYIKKLDKSMKVFFSIPDKEDEVLARIDEIYRNAD